jgi:tetratricopeptide (TPR) repeat protein
MHFNLMRGLVVVLLLASVLVTSGAGPARADDIQRARELTDDGWWNQAEYILRGLAENGSSDPEVYHNLAEIGMMRLFYRLEVDWDDVEKYADKAIDLDNTKAEYYITLGNIIGMKAQQGNKLRAMGRAKKARKAIEAALEIDPDNLDARDWLMNYYLYAPGFAGGDKDKARAMADDIAGIDSVAGYIGWAAIYEFDDEDIEAAETAYLNALALEPEDAEVYFAYAYFCARNGEPGKAEATAAELLGKEWIDDETRGRVHRDLAGMYRGDEEWEKAIAEYEKAVEADPTEMYSMYQLGTTYILAETNLDEAERIFKMYMKQPRLKGWWPTMADAHYRLACVYNIKGDKEAARAEVEKALVLDPDHDSAKDLKRDIIYGRR